MKIRKAEKKDIPRILSLLGQVLQIHAEIRPDIFIPGTTKYTPCELTELLQQEDHPIYVAVDEDDLCMGYAFCQLREQPFSTNMVPFKSLFIDDLCVDKQTRGQHIGESLFEYVKQQAKELGCYEVTLNVWAGNTSAEHFYETMRHVRQDGKICYDVYSLEMVIAIAFKLRTKECMAFRRFIMDKLCSANSGNLVQFFFSLSNPHPRCTC